MPIIRVEMWKGATKEIKSELARTLSEDMARIAGKRKERVLALLASLKNLWSSGRQSRFLADLSPKFVAGAILTVKNPIFLESGLVNGSGGINVKAIEETLSDFAAEIIDSVFGVRDGQFASAPDSAVSVGEAFDKMGTWVSERYAD